MTITFLFFRIFKKSKGVIKFNFIIFFLRHFKKYLKFVNMSFWEAQSWPQWSFCVKNIGLCHTNF